MEYFKHVQRTVGRGLFTPLLVLLICVSNRALGQQYNGFAYTSAGTNVTITGYTGSGGTVAIPSSIPGVGTVTVVGDWTFSACASLTGVTIPNSVTVIGSEAFENCVNLATVTIGNGVTSIGQSAFFGCISLTNAHFLGNAPSLSWDVFAYEPSDFIIYYSSTATGWTTPLWKGYPAEPFDSAKGSLTVTMSPFGAVSAGAQWQVDGWPSQNSGATVRNLTVGDHVITYSTVNGWIPPSSQTVTINSNSTTTATGSYVATDFIYSGSGTNVTVIGYLGSGGAVSIPSSIPGVGTVTGIGSSAFNFKSSLTSVTIPDSVTAIGSWAFSGCVNLTSVAIPTSVNLIGDGAFSTCSNLTEVIIPNGVTFIYPQTFFGCASLTNVTIPTGVTSIGTLAFDGCGRLKNISIPNSVTSIGNASFGSCTSLVSVLIPDSVTSIGNNAFGNCASLTAINVDPNNTVYSSLNGVLFNQNQSLLIQYPPASANGSYTIPSSVTTINNYAFNSCVSLTNVTIPDTVTSIGDNAFNGCASLISVSIPGNITSIGSQTFYKCTRLASVRIPDSVTSISSYAFSGCSSLVNITIPDGVKFIGPEAFYACTSLTSVTIPNSVTSIQSETFFGCTNLTNVVIGNGLASVGFEAFYGCSNLTSAYFKGNAPSSFDSGAFLGTPSGFTIYYPSTATGWTAPTAVWKKYHPTPYEMPHGSLTVTILPSDTLGAMLRWQVDGGAWQRSGVTISNLPVGIHAVSFYSASGWLAPLSQTVTVSSNSITGITNTYILLNYKYSTSGTNVIITGYAGPGGTVTIPAVMPGIGTVSAIKDSAFLSCTALTNIIIPSTVTNIGKNAFYGCLKLNAIDVDPSNAVYSSLNGVLFNKSQSSLIRYPAGLASTYAIPDGVTNIDTWAFSDCPNLTNLAIPGSLASIGYQAFFYCPRLNAIDVDPDSSAYSSLNGVLFDKKLNQLIQYPAALTGAYNVPGSVTGIQDNAFLYCTSLTSVTIPDSVVNIGQEAFAGCSNLANVVIGSGVTNIGNYAFDDCATLIAIDVASNNTAYSSLDGVLFDKGKSLLIHCPARFAGACVIPGSVTSIGYEAFANCALSSVTIPNSVTNIDNWAFYSCTNLANVVIGSGVATIGADAFGGCFKLTRISIPNSVSSIGLDAFYGCSSLTNVVIGSGIMNIDDEAFGWCTSLTAAYFSGNAPHFGASVFSGDNLTTVYYRYNTTGWDSAYLGRPTALWELRVNVSRDDANIILTWPQGVLLETTNLATGPWVTNTSTLSPYTNSPAGPQKYYRVIIP